MKTNPKTTETKITEIKQKTTGTTPKTTKTKTTVKKPKKITKKDDIKTMIIDKNYEPKQPEINNTKNTNHSNLLQTITNSILIIFTTINIIKMIINFC
jgi:hypothetical protein